LLECPVGFGDVHGCPGPAGDSIDLLSLRMVLDDFAIGLAALCAPPPASFPQHWRSAFSV